MTVRLDFTSEAFFRDPPKAIAKLRMSAPVVATRFPIIGNVWITTTHDATAQVLKDGATFTLRKEDGDIAGLRWWMPRFVRTIANNMLTMDEPDHTRLRSIVDEAFRRRAIVAMEPRIGPSLTVSPTSCLRRNVRRIWSSATRASCRSR
ncbi:cytochrome P450 [Bradyrhizobium sp. USDA 223]